MRREAQTVLCVHLCAGDELELSFVIRDGLNIVGRKPTSNMVVQQTIPPTGFELSEYLDERTLREGERAGVVGFEIVESAHKEGRWFVRVVSGARSWIIERRRDICETRLRRACIRQTVAEGGSRSRGHDETVSNWQWEAKAC